MSFSVQIDSAALEAQLSQLPEVCRRAAAMAINDTGQEVRTAAVENLHSHGTSDTGNLAQHIFLDEASSGSLEATVRAETPYAAPVEKGSRPHFPPPDALVGWARRHGAADPESAAFLIARAISEGGTKAQPFMGPAYHQYVPGRLMERLKSAIDAAMRSL